MPPKRFQKAMLRPAPTVVSSAEKKITYSRPRINYTLSRRGGRDYRPRMRVERKFVDSGQIVTACDTTGGITLINVIPQGATTSNRIGKRCFLKSVQIHGFFYTGTTAIINNLCALLVLDRQSNGAAIPAITDIMVSVNANEFANDAKIPRYKILRRWDTVVSGLTLAAASAPMNDCPSCNINDFVKLDFEMEFNTTATTGVQSTIEKGAIYMVTMGSAPAGTTAGSFQYYTRTRFEDEH